MRDNTQEHPIDVPTAATVDFVASLVPTGGSILEIGCGSGDVAAALTNREYRVIGIESDESAVLRARSLGVQVMAGSWPDVITEKVNAVFFSRSLHHISPLSKAISKIRNVLLPQGLVLVEDFAFDEVSPDTISWFLKRVTSRIGRSLISHSANSFVTKLLNTDDPVTAWHQDHDHDLHTFDEMTREIGEYFVIRETKRVPYLYRYLLDVLPDTHEATAFVAETYREESRLGEIGDIVFIGRRILAQVT